jgi:hypothetical protein
MEKKDSSGNGWGRLGGIRRGWTQFALILAALIVITLLIILVVVPIVRD